jgi:DNA-binding MarR family transcriptional regulator
MDDLQEKARLVAATCACMRIRQASRAITQLYESALKSAGLGAGQFTALVATRVAGEGGIPITRLARALVLDRTSLTRTLKPLENAGWVKIGTDPEDARVRRVSLTAGGAKKLTRALELWEDAQRDFVAQVGATEWKGLHKDLGRVVGALGYE